MKDITPTREATREVALFPLRSPLFPDGLMALQLFEVRYLSMIRRVMKGELQFAIVSLLEGSEVNRPNQLEKFIHVATLVEVLQHQEPGPGLVYIRCRGGQRVRIESSERATAGLWMARVIDLEPDPPEPIDESDSLACSKLGALIAELQRQGVQEDQMPFLRPHRLDECGWVANRWAEILPLPAGEKQSLLMERNPRARLDTINRWLDELVA